MFDCKITRNTCIYIKKHTGLFGEFDIPGDKSFSHRAVILGSIFPGTLSIQGSNLGEDVSCTITALQTLGKRIEHYHDELFIEGNPAWKMLDKPVTLWMGNSGTSARLLLGLLASYPGGVLMKGDASLSMRPMKRVLDPLRIMGVKAEHVCSLEGSENVTLSNNETLPISIAGANQLVPLSYTIPIPSAQIKSALLLAGLFTKGKTILKEQWQTRTHTEDLLRKFGYPIMVNANNVIELEGFAFPKTKPRTLQVPKDPSLAAFFIVGALLIPNSSIMINNILDDPFRLSFLDILKKMGGSIHKAGSTIFAKASCLEGVCVDPDMAPSLIDEYPILFIAASLAKGISCFKGLKELRHKESNRLEGMRNLLQKCGVHAWIKDDSMYVEGNPNLLFSPTLTIDPEQDHRVAMSFAILGACIQGITLVNSDCINTSFPGFLKLCT